MQNSEVCNEVHDSLGGYIQRNESYGVQKVLAINIHICHCDTETEMYSYRGQHIFHADSLVHD